MLRAKLPAALAAAAVLACGCVLREMVIRSEPPGAEVYIDGHLEGRTPLVKQFDFYSSRDVAVRMDGYGTAQGVVSPSIPWYEYFPLDLVFELVFPFTLRNRHEYDFKLEPLPERAPRDLLEKAREARSRE